MSSHNELVKVKATFYEPGNVVSYDTLLEAEENVWWFEDENAGVLWDALDDPDISEGDGMFTMHAIRFQFEFHAKPMIGDKTPLEYHAKWMGFDEAFGGETEDFDALLNIACEHFPRFWTMYDNTVWFFVVYAFGSFRVDEDDSQEEWYLLGEVDFERLPFAAPPSKLNRPKIVCICGSMRFADAFHEAERRETLAGHIVTSSEIDMRSDVELFAHLPEDELKKLKWELDALHLRKIELADEVYVLNVDGYIGESVRNEIWHAEFLGKPIRYLEPILDESEGA